jgi:hypothetical protein
VKKIICRLDHRPLWGWAAALHRLFGAAGSGADWRPVTSILAGRFDDERGVRMAQSLCPGPRISAGRGTMLAPTVLRREAAFLEVNGETQKATLIQGLRAGGMAVEIEVDLGDAWSESALLASVVAAVGRVSASGSVVFIPEQERNLVGVTFEEAESLILAPETIAA